MKLLLFFSTLLGTTIANAATQRACLDGNYSDCKKIFEEYGRTSDRRGAVEFFTNVCASQNFKLNCTIISALPSETMKKILDSSTPERSVFTIDGQKMTKIYLVEPIK